MFSDFTWEKKNLLQEMVEGGAGEGRWRYSCLPTFPYGPVLF